MKRPQLDSLLDELARARTRASRRRIVDGLNKVQREDWFSAAERQRVETACAAAGVNPDPWQSRTLGVGESWLLLYRLGAQRGRVARIRARPRPEINVAGVLRYELEQALTGLRAAAGKACRQWPDELNTACIHIDADEVVGGSLGVAACAALLSRALEKPPAGDVAASAEVACDGTLRPVEHLEAKLIALRCHAPEVRRVIVAAHQREVTVPSGIELVRCRSLEEASSAMGLRIEDLPAADLHAYQRRFDEFTRTDERSLSTSDWLAQAQLANETGQALRALDDPDKAAKSFVWAALFALHAGDPDLAKELIGQVPAGKPLGEEAGAWRDIVDASHMIDEDARTAVARARSALARCRSVAPHIRENMLGRALGTLGRALMHAGSAAEAEPFLREATAHHAKHLHYEEPRSRCYLAQCQRVQGRLIDALQTLNQALATLSSRRGHPLANKTRAYVQLERGRCLLALSRPSEALDALQEVRDRQAYDEDYPRLAALRGLAAAHRALGQHERAGRFLARCLAVVDQATTPTLARVALAAAGDALISEAPNLDRESLKAAWLRAFPECEDPDRIRERIRTLIY